MYRFHPSAYSPVRNPQSVSNFLVCPTCTFEFQRSIPTSLFPIWNANLSCAHDCILSCSPGDPINAALYRSVGGGGTPRGEPLTAELEALPLVIGADGVMV